MYLDYKLLKNLIFLGLIGIGISANASQVALTFVNNHPISVMRKASMQPHEARMPSNGLPDCTGFWHCEHYHRR